MTYKGWIVLVLGMLALLVWRGPGKSQEAVVFTTTAPPQTQTALQTQGSKPMPWVLSQAGLIVERMVAYEGPFWEDGSDDPVVDIMALQVYNPGPSGIRHVRIEAEQGSRILAFEITWLPPNSRVLVLERSRQSYQEIALSDCRSTDLDKTPWVSDPEITVTPEGMCSLLAENRGQAPAAVLLRYKTFDEKEGLYLGGITYCLQLPTMAPGEITCVTPYRYLVGGSRLVQVEGKEELKTEDPLQMPTTAA